MAGARDRESKTAAELIAELEIDPGHRARRGARQRAHLERVAGGLRALAPLHRDLAKAGIVVGHVDELRQSGQRYDAAIPILLEWLPRLKDAVDREVVVRALSVPWAGDKAMRTLLARFRATPNAEFQLKWAIGNGIEILASGAYFAEMAALARDTAHGKARQMVVLGLGKFHTAESRQILTGLLDDADVRDHAAEALERQRTGR